MGSREDGDRGHQPEAQGGVVPPPPGVIPTPSPGAPPTPPYGAGPPPPVSPPPVARMHGRTPLGTRRKLVVAVVIVGLLALVGISIGIVALVKYAKEPIDVANEFFAATKAGEMDKAMSHVSERVFKTSSREEVRASVQTFGEDLQSYDANEVEVSGSVTTVTAEIVYNDGSRGQAELILQKEDGKYRILSIYFE